MYTKITWYDRNVQYPNRYKDQNLTQYTFTADPGTITQAGTTITAANMNRIEKGVEAVFKTRLGGLSLI